LTQGLLALVIASLALAVPVPQIPNDYSGQSKIMLMTREGLWELDGQVSVDHTGGRHRIDANGRVGKLDVWKIWSDDKSGVEYELNTTACKATPFESPNYGTFDWMAKAHYDGNCSGSDADGHVDGHSFVLARGTWGVDLDEFELCYSRDDKPLWLHQTSHHADWVLDLMVIYRSFQSGRPSEHLFVVPDECKPSHKRNVECRCPPGSGGWCPCRDGAKKPEIAKELKIDELKAPCRCPPGSGGWCPCRDGAKKPEIAKELEIDELQAPCRCPPGSGGWCPCKAQGKAKKADVNQPCRCPPGSGGWCPC